MSDLIPLIIETILRTIPEVTPLISKEVWAVYRAAEGFDGIRNTYWAEIYDAVYEYLTGDKPVTAFRNKALVAMAEAFTDAAVLGYEEAGAELPFDEDTQAWIDSAVAEQRGFIIDMFDRLRDEWDGLDPIDEAFARADGYAKTLDAIYAEARMRGAPNATAEFVGDDGESSCETCTNMQGKRHKLSYIIEHDLIPRPGNENFICKCFNCSHYWVNVKTGEEYR